MMDDRDNPGPNRISGIGVAREPGAARGRGAGSPARRLTICHVLFSLQRGGAEVLAARLARNLVGSYRTVFACLDGTGDLADELTADGFSVHLLDRRPGIDYPCARRLAHVLRRERVDVVHAHQYGPFFYAALARLPFRNPPILFTEHGRPFPDETGRWHGLANRILLGRRDCVVGVGEAVRGALIEKEGIPAGRVGVIYNGVVTSNFSNVEVVTRNEVRRELGLGADDFVVAQVARLNPIKDHATALRAMARLVGPRPNARLVVVGEGPSAGEIAEQVRALNLGQNVLTLGLRDDIPRLLRASDAAILTSHSEGIPLSLIEAMAASLPVVSTSVGGVPEVVEDGATGLLVPPGDDARLADALLRLSSDPDLRARLGRSGRNRAETAFSEAQMHAAYSRAYDALAAV